MKFRQTHIKALLTVCLLWAAPVLSSTPLTKETAAEHIQKESGGKVLSVDEVTESAQTRFKVKVLHDDGRIKVYQLDAATGEAIN